MTGLGLMNWKTSLSLTLLASVLVINPAFAAKTIKSCEKIDDNIEHSQCLDSVKKLSEKELQTWVNNQVFTLEELALKTGRKAALALFKRSQKNFITFRENNCRWQYLAISPDKEAANAYKKCFILTNKRRIQELEMLGK